MEFGYASDSDESDQYVGGFHLNAASSISNHPDIYRRAAMMQRPVEIVPMRFAPSKSKGTLPVIRKDSPIQVKSSKGLDSVHQAPSFNTTVHQHQREEPSFNTVQQHQREEPSFNVVNHQQQEPPSFNTVNQQQKSLKAAPIQKLKAMPVGGIGWRFTCSPLQVLKSVEEYCVAKKYHMQGDGDTWRRTITVYMGGIQVKVQVEVLEESGPQYVLVATNDSGRLGEKDRQFIKIARMLVKDCEKRFNDTSDNEKSKSLLLEEELEGQMEMYPGCQALTRSSATLLLEQIMECDEDTWDAVEQLSDYSTNYNNRQVLANTNELFVQALHVLLNASDVQRNEFAFYLLSEFAQDRPSTFDVSPYLPKLRQHVKVHGKPPFISSTFLERVP